MVLHIHISVPSRRAAALKYHPDKAGPELPAAAAGVLFKLVSSAYTLLSNTDARRAHDLATVRHRFRRPGAYCA